MRAPRRLPPALETAAVLALGVGAIYLALLPYSLEPERLPAPDLVFCLVLAWVVRRPAEAPLWAILGLGLLADLLLSRPVGLGALALVLAAEVTRPSAASLQAGPFAAEWLTAAGLSAATLLGVHAALELAFVDGPGLRPLLLYAATTALAYPVAVAALAFGLGMRAPRRSRASDRLGRIA